MPFSSQQILDSLPIAVIVTDLHGQIVRANAALCGLLGYAEAQLVGRSLSAISAGEGGGPIQSALDDLASGEPPRPFTMELVARSGQSVPANLLSGVITDEGGRPTGASFVVAVITLPKGNRPKAGRPRRRSSPRGRH